jgi:hypothetical protein
MMIYDLWSLKLDRLNGVTVKQTLPSFYRTKVLLIKSEYLMLFEYMSFKFVY